MSIAHSPLRYPGGKQVLARVLSHLMRLNGLAGGIYAEPYAGGGGAALWLLFGEYVDRILINDFDKRVFAFWDSVLNRTKSFLKLLETTDPTPAEWEQQREIYLTPSYYSALRVGFSAFFLNRCNRSGIISGAGMIGGKDQRGRWKIDARYNKRELAKRIEKIARFRERIVLSNEDALAFLDRIEADPTSAARTFVYLDPPYYRKGSQLYLNYYEPKNHKKVAKALQRPRLFKWAMTYDNVSEIRALYSAFHRTSFDLDYSAKNGQVGKEVLIYPDNLRFPQRWISRIPPRYVTAADGVAIPIEG